MGFPAKPDLWDFSLELVWHIEQLLSKKSLEFNPTFSQNYLKIHVRIKSSNWPDIGTITLKVFQTRHEDMKTKKIADKLKTVNGWTCSI